MSETQPPINCLVVDDEPLALALLSDYIAKLPSLRLINATSDPLKALAAATSGKADLVFLDMQMPELSGLQFLKVLQRRCLVIVTTAYGEYALDGYEHHVVDYLLKPITFDRFLMAVDKATSRLQRLPQGVQTDQATSTYIFIRTDHRMVKVELADILYLEAARDYVIVHTRNEQLLTLESLKSLEERLPAARFMRLHRSYIIALDKIDFVERNRVSLNGNLLPVSESYKSRLDLIISSGWQ